MAPVVKPPKVQISRDGLEATMTFAIPEGGAPPVEYSITQLIGFLNAAGVTYGIDQDMIARLATNITYQRPVTVAKGYPPEEGQPGHFDFKFDQNLMKKPIIRPDGSTDYMNIKTIEIVHKDDVIAEYHPAVQGTSGMGVRGVPLPAKPCRDLPPLVGRGFTRSSDNLVYTSLLDGKIELNKNRVLISPVHEVKGDADITTGNIDFNGDVVINGGVTDGVTIRAAGNITVKGLVENCEIYAGRDLFLLAGTKGGEKTNIEVGGSLTAQFMEYVNVHVGKNITADYLFKSNIKCDGRIDLTGEKSSIIGGNTSAVAGIDVEEIGNQFGTTTVVAVGVDSELVDEMNRLRMKINTLNDNIVKIKNGLAAFNKVGAERDVDFSKDPRRMQLLRVKIRDEATINKDREDLTRLEEIADNGRDSTVRVFKKVHAGVKVSIDDNKVILKDDFVGVEFVKVEDGIQMKGMK